jgi:cell division protease FtsH
VPPQGWGGQPPNSVPHNYGAPPDWRPATTPHGQSWPPPGHWQQPTQQWAPPPDQVPPPHQHAGANGAGEAPKQPQPEKPSLDKPSGESGSGPDEGGSR